MPYFLIDGIFGRRMHVGPPTKAQFLVRTLGSPPNMNEPSCESRKPKKEFLQVDSHALATPFDSLNQKFAVSAYSRLLVLVSLVHELGRLNSSRGIHSLVPEPNSADLPTSFVSIISTQLTSFGQHKAV